MRRGRVDDEEGGGGLEEEGGRGNEGGWWGEVGEEKECLKIVSFENYW